MLRITGGPLRGYWDLEGILREIFESGGGLEIIEGLKGIFGAVLRGFG